ARCRNLCSINCIDVAPEPSSSVPSTHTRCMTSRGSLRSVQDAIASHALCRVFVACASWRVGRFGDHSRRIVRELERATAHSGRYAAARNLFWDLLVYLLEGLVFLATGLQIRTVLDRLDPISLRGPLLAVLLTVAVVVVARFVWVFPATYLPRWLS